MKKQEIKVVLRSYDHQQLDKAVKEIVRAVKKAGSTIVGPIPHPNKIIDWTVLRSPNNDKKSREQFQLITHKRVLGIEVMLNQQGKGGEETMDALMKLQIPSSVDVEIR